MNMSQRYAAWHFIGSLFALGVTIIGHGGLEWWVIATGFVVTGHVWVAASWIARQR